jgi:hypothetical protein
VCSARRRASSERLCASCACSYALDERCTSLLGQVSTRRGSPSRSRRLRVMERLEDPVVSTVVDHFVRELQRSQSSVVYMLDRAPLCLAAPPDGLRHTRQPCTAWVVRWVPSVAAEPVAYARSPAPGDPRASRRADSARSLRTALALDRHQRERQHQPRRAAPRALLDRSALECSRGTRA